MTAYRANISSTARLVRAAQRAEQDCRQAEAALQRAQLRAWQGNANAAAAMPALLHSFLVTVHRANTAQHIAARHLQHRPTGTRPVYPSAPGSTMRIIATALRGRRQLLILRIGYVGAWFECRDAQQLPAIYAPSWE